MRCRETAVYDALAYFQLTLLCLRPSFGQEVPLSTLPCGPTPTSFKFVFSTLLFYRGIGVSETLLDSTHTQVECKQGFCFSAASQFIHATKHERDWPLRKSLL